MDSINLKFILTLNEFFYYTFNSDYEILLSPHTIIHSFDETFKCLLRCIHIYGVLSQHHVLATLKNC